MFTPVPLSGKLPEGAEAERASSSSKTTLVAGMGNPAQLLLVPLHPRLCCPSVKIRSSLATSPAVPRVGHLPEVYSGSLSIVLSPPITVALH